MKAITLKTLAAETGLDGRTVAGILRRAGLDAVNGAYPATAARKAVEGGLEPGLAAGQAMAGRGNVTSPAIAALSMARARSEAARARKLELAIEVQEGKLVDRQQVDFAMRDLIRRTVAAFEGMGVKLASKLVDLSDPVKVAAIVEAEVRSILAEYSSADALVAELLA